MRLIGAIVACVVVVVVTVTASGGPAFKVKPWVYDPDDLGVSSAAWVTHEGLPDGGTSDHALYLSKLAVTSANTASGASVTGVDGITLTELGFDYRNDGHCGAGAPRFNVYTAAGTYYFFGCTYGVHTSQGANWTRVRFTNSDAYPADGSTAFPGFGATTVTGIEIVFDEGTEVGPGYVYVDNIDVNGVLAGKPGLAQ